MKRKEYRDASSAWTQVTKDHPEFKGLQLPAEGRKISGRKHGTARYEEEEKDGVITWIHVVVVGSFGSLLYAIVVLF